MTLLVILAVVSVVVLVASLVSVVRHDGIGHRPPPSSSPASQDWWAGSPVSWSR